MSRRHARVRVLAPSVGQSLLALSNISLVGYKGIHSAIGDVPNPTRVFGLRYVSGARRFLMCDSSVNSSNGWTGDRLFEVSDDGVYAAAPPTQNVGSPRRVNAYSNTYCVNEVASRSWPASQWQRACPNGDIIILCGWWDEAQWVWWYCTRENYGSHALPFLHAVTLNNDLTCTHWGPWSYGDTASDAFHTNQYNRVAFRLNTIPSSVQASFGSKTHIMGGDIASAGGEYQTYGLSVVAVTLPTLTAYVGGSTEATNYTAPDVYTFYIYRADASLFNGITWDGTVGIHFMAPSGSSTWPYGTIVTSATYEAGSSRWKIVGDQTFAAYSMGAGTTRVAWCVSRWMDPGLVLADYSITNDASLDSPDYHMHRTDDGGVNAAYNYNLNLDPYYGGISGAGIGVDLTTGTRGGSEGAGQAYAFNPASVPSSTTFTLPTGSLGTDDAFNHHFVQVFNNTPSGLLFEVRRITDYVGSTRTVTIDAAFSQAITTSTQLLIRKFYVTGQESGTCGATGSTTTIVLVGDVTNVATGQYIHLTNNTPSGALHRSGYINSWNAGSKTATMFAAWGGGVVPASGTTYTVAYEDQFGSANLNEHFSTTPASSSPVAITGTESVPGGNLWNAEIDMAFTSVWIQTATRRGVLFLGRRATGDVWYHHPDTYIGFGVNALSQASNVTQTWGFNAEGYVSAAWVHDPTQLLEVYAGTRSNSSDGTPLGKSGINATEIGDWLTQWGIQPTPYDTLGGESYITPFLLGGGSQMAVWDETASQLLILFPELYSLDGVASSLPLIGIFTVA